MEPKYDLDKLWKSTNASFSKYKPNPCRNCGVEESSLWATDPDGTRLCSKCHECPTLNLMLERLIGILKYFKSAQIVLISSRLTFDNEVSDMSISSKGERGFRFGGFTFLYRDMLKGVVVFGSHPLANQDFDINVFFDFDDHIKRIYSTSHGHVVPAGDGNGNSHYYDCKISCDGRNFVKLT